MATTLERLTVDLEAAAHPALDDLTAKVGPALSADEQSPSHTSGNETLFCCMGLESSMPWSDIEQRHSNGSY